jgi:uncharacterized membrane protein YhhN
MKSKMIIYIFWILCITDIFAITFNYPILQWLAKPLLLPCLVYLFITQTNYSKENTCRLMITGLLFCWLGDVLLMFESSHPLFFIFGLASFLAGHIFYIIYFSKLPAETKKVPGKNLLIVLPVAVYVFVLLYILYPSLGDLKIPVTVYAIVIGVMLSMALLQYQKIDNKTALIFIAGATSFVVSDSLLAINKFYQPFSNAGFFIMLTYCVAQYLIAIGGIKLYRNKNSISN